MLLLVRQFMDSGNNQWSGTDMIPRFNVIAGVALAAVLLFALWFPARSGGADKSEKEPSYTEASNYLENRGVTVDPTTFPPTASLEESIEKEGVLWGAAVRIDPHDRISNGDLAVLPELNPIFRLSIDHPAITEQGLKIVKDLKGLRWVGLRHDSAYGYNIAGGDVTRPVSPEVADRISSYLADSKDLESLRFTGPLSGETMGQFNQHKDLRILALQDAFLTEEGMRQMGTLTQLESLSLVHCHVTDAELRHLAGLKNLLALSLTKNPITGRGLASLEKLDKLMGLNLNSCFLSDEGTASLGKLESLQSLLLINNQIGDRTLERLAAGGLKQLQLLHLERTDVTDEGMKYLASLPKLETVCLADTRVTGGGMKHLGGLGKLISVDLRQTNVTDDNVQGLRNLTQVGWIFLDGTKITDAAIPALSKLDQLQFLSVSHTGITEKGIDELKKSLPKCKIDNSGRKFESLLEDVVDPHARAIIPGRGGIGSGPLGSGKKSEE